MEQACPRTNVDDEQDLDFPGRIPASIRHGSTLDQMEFLERHYERPRAPHIFQTRASVPLGKRRFYLAVYFGREKRNLDRLRHEGQLETWSVLIATALLLCLAIGALAVMASVTAILVEHLSPALVTSMAISALIMRVFKRKSPR